MIEQLPDGAVAAAAIDRVRIEVARDHERGLDGEPVAPTCVIDEVGSTIRRQVVRPEPDLIVVSAAVAVLGAVEARRGRMTGEQVEHTRRRTGRRIRRHGQFEGQVPMALRGQRQRRERVRAIPPGGQVSARHVPPQEVSEAAHLIAAQREARADQHAVLPGGQTESACIVAATDAAVAIEVDAARQSGVRGCAEERGAGDRFATALAHLEIAAQEGEGCRGGRTLRVVVVNGTVVVEFIDQQQIGAHILQHGSDRRSLGAAFRGEFLCERARLPAIKADIVGSDAQGAGGDGRRGRARRVR